MIEVDIISGFLGAGKTTFINKLLAEKGTQNTVLVENEFGAVNVDAQLVGDGLTVMNINSGCICCTLLGDFVTGIRQIVNDYRPAHILVEPSGAAALSDVVAACEKACMGIDARIHSVITVVSVEALPALCYAGGPLYRSQIAEAEYILMNGVEQAAEEDLAECKELLTELNSTAPVCWEPWDELSADELLQQAAEIHQLLPQRHALRLTRGKRLCVEVFTPSPVNDDWLNNFGSFLENGELGQVFRIKGFVRHVDGDTLLLEYTAGRGVSWRRFNGSDLRLCVIGIELNFQRLTELFKCN